MERMIKPEKNEINNGAVRYAGIAEAVYRLCKRECLIIVRPSRLIYQACSYRLRYPYFRPLQPVVPKAGEVGGFYCRVLFPPTTGLPLPTRTILTMRGT